MTCKIECKVLLANSYPVDILAYVSMAKTWLKGSGERTELQYWLFYNTDLIYYSIYSRVNNETMYNIS